ncbi:RluA family pseudouridine synthase [Pseudochelatococcus lubricantis]|uniref:RluA family pseudouridine synthase n=1 Tax=Pseudochelatococcus lubricantis TaxID=1538102 RepID=UPI0035ECC4CF
MRRVLYRDALMLVIDKPAGLPVHPGPRNSLSRSGRAGTQTLTQFLLALRFGLPRVPELAHRLDRDTSGCLVLGRHRKALERLGKLFKGNQAHKTYWAIVEGGPEAETGEIELPLAPRDPDRGWWMKVDPAGQPALTRWRVLGRAGGRTWLALEPVTGRTHQLRVHCSASGFPILGDAVYGHAPRFGGPGLHLHARAITLPLYPKREPVHVEAPLPAHMAETFAALGFDAPAPSGSDKLPPVVGADDDGQELAGNR